MTAPPDRSVAIGAILVMVLLVSCQRTFSRFDFDGDGIDDHADCEPENPDVYPGAPDPWGVGGDTNCDGVDGVDSDEDGYPGNAGVDERLHDCHDGNPAVHPGAEEIPCDGLDNDCDTATAEAPDADGDGVSTCDGDCDDGDPAVFPGADEGCDGLDGDCDGVPGDEEVDEDGDGWMACEGDCDDEGEDAGCGHLDSSDLGGANVIFDAEATGDGAGVRVAPAGDVDADGHDDVLIAANLHGDDLDEQGMVYLVHGPVELGTFDLADAATRLVGEDGGDRAGEEALAGGGDLDGDGLDDIAIGVPLHDPSDMGDAGAVYVIAGSPPAGTLGLGSATAKITGLTAGDRLGRAVALDGDVDGDGTDDLLIGAHQAGNGSAGMACVVPGPVPTGTNSVSALTSSCLAGEQDGDMAGASVAYLPAAGGADSILVGAFRWGDQHGAVYLLSWPLEDVSLDGAATVFRGSLGESAGAAVAAAGDLDGDGEPDILIGAHNAADERGRVYVQLSPAPLGEVDLSDVALVLEGATDLDEAGRAVAATDLDADGFSDLLIGAPGHASERGAVYVLHGPLEAGTYDLASEADAILTGEAGGDYAGWGLAGAGDVDGDGYPDLLVGAQGHDGGTGRAYLLYAGLP